MENIGLQLYTVRDLLNTEEQAVETLTKIKEMELPKGNRKDRRCLKHF